MFANLEVAAEALLHASRNWGVPHVTKAATRPHFWLLLTPCKGSNAESEMHTDIHWAGETSPQVRMLATKLDDLTFVPKT